MLESDVTIGELSRRLDERDTRLERRLESIDDHLKTLNGSVARHERDLAVEASKRRNLEQEVFARAKTPADASAPVPARKPITIGIDTDAKTITTVLLAIAALVTAIVKGLL